MAMIKSRLILLLVGLIAASFGIDIASAQGGVSFIADDFNGDKLPDLAVANINSNDTCLPSRARAVNRY